jgi:PAS domain-containing protein
VSGTNPTFSRDTPWPLVAGPAVVPFDAVPFAMLIVDPAAEVVALNTKWLQLSGLTRAASFGSGWLSILPPASRSEVRIGVRAVATTGASATAEYRVGAAGRRTRWWLTSYERVSEGLVSIAVADSAPADPAVTEPPRADPAVSDAAAASGSEPEGDRLCDELLAALPTFFHRLEAVLATLGELVHERP